jgi:hypothetical protein
VLSVDFDEATMPSRLRDARSRDVDRNFTSEKAVPSMASKRATTKSSAPTVSAASPPLVNALLLVLALGSGFVTLFSRGKLSWPPTQLLASVYTVAGFLALIGPFVLHRRVGGEVALGELLWMAGGLVVWVFDLASLARGEFKTTAWSTPLGYQPMGLTILAVLLTAWRCKLAGSSWSWTNVTGWVLGLFWVGMAAYTLLPPRVLGVAMR